MNWKSEHNQIFDSIAWGNYASTTTKIMSSHNDLKWHFVYLFPLNSTYLTIIVCECSKFFLNVEEKNWYSSTALLSYIHNSIDIQMNEKHFPAFSSISAIHQVALPFFMLSSWHPLECGLCFIFHLRFSWKRVCLSTFSYGVA